MHAAYKVHTPLRIQNQIESIAAYEVCFYRILVICLKVNIPE